MSSARAVRYRRLALAAKVRADADLLLSSQMNAIRGFSARLSGVQRGHPSKMSSRQRAPVALLIGLEMPLVSDPKSKPLSHSNSRAIGFWMSVEGRTPIQPVRVLVSYEALSELDPTNIRDLHGALENFDRFRSQIESAASRKFDRDGFDPDKYEGMPAIRLITNDLT